jgi:TRAP-type C4-dicarboxylate transport system permease small subunit
MLQRWHDAATEVGAAIAALCVAIMACIYTAEVLARYFLSAPLNWSGDVSSYLLCACAFLALPKVSRDGGHVAITYILERMGSVKRANYSDTLRKITGVTCLAAGIIVAYEAAQLCAEGVLTSQATQIPKWLIGALACLGLFSSALHLFGARGAIAKQPEAKP